MELIGLLGEKTIAGHCIYVTEEDIRILADSNTQVAHLSGSNAKGGMMAQIKKFMEAGINIGLGTDNMDGDMVGAMRMALCIARMREDDPRAIRAYDVLDMATRNGARAVGIQDEVGSLEAGKKADLIAIDFQKPHLIPVMDPVANLVHNGQGGDVDMVVINGEIVVKDREIQTIDERSLLIEAQLLARTLWDSVS